jgi:hypothetical protein
MKWGQSNQVQVPVPVHILQARAQWGGLLALPTQADSAWVDRTGIEAVGPEDGHRDVAVRSRVDAVRGATGFNIDGNIQGGNGPGHVSVTTTIRYLGLKDENLREAAEILAAKYRPPVENDSDCDATGKRYLLSDDPPSERERGKHILSQAVAYVRRLTAETG